MNTQSSVKDLVLTQGNYTAVSNKNITSLSSVKNVKANDLVVYSCLLHQSYIVGTGNFVIKSFLTKFSIGKDQFSRSAQLLEDAGYIKITRYGSRFQKLAILNQTSDLKDFSAVSNSLLMASKNVLSIGEKAFLIMFWKHIQPSGNHLDLDYHNSNIEAVLGLFATDRWYESTKTSLAKKGLIEVERGNKYFFRLNFSVIADVIGNLQVETDAKLTIAESALQESNLRVRELERENKTLKSIADNKTKRKHSLPKPKKSTAKKSVGFNEFDYGIEL